MHTTISSARLEGTLICARTDLVVNRPQKVCVAVWTSPVLAATGSGSMSKRRLLAERGCAPKMLDPMWEVLMNTIAANKSQS
jgi:hypothetical protein